MSDQPPYQTSEQAGSQPMTDADLFAKLDAMGIAHHTVEHEAAYTVDQAQHLRGELEGAHIKNLFLRDKKKNIWLVTVLEERDVDLKALRGVLGAKGNLSFGSPELLMECLGVIPGSVTPLGVVNDREGRVSVVLDKGILDHDQANVHPLRNDRTTQIASPDLLKLLEAEAHPPTILDFADLPQNQS